MGRKLMSASTKMLSTTLVSEELVSSKFLCNDYLEPFLSKLQIAGSI